MMQAGHVAKADIYYIVRDARGNVTPGQRVERTTTDAGKVGRRHCSGKQPESFVTVFRGALGT